ncbi:hypothetical protein CKF54_02015 [Psittacicella hinzii]|uniref:Uncharacterized protein n=1 Tax=Psittacicella hinzii TaxID=2028575 RepID=A0A3A1YCE6_9GAMM|nr:hypothetical protein [Psittacicella hinzii]RIY33884.1 hypothetical protein CKF54_02015 [Psittacicella hinzii]
MSFPRVVNYKEDLFRAILIELEFTVNFTNRLNFNDPVVNSIFHLNRTLRSNNYPLEISYNNDMARAFRLLNASETKNQATGTGLLVLTFSSLYASLLISNNKDRDLRHILLMKIVTYYDYYLNEVDKANSFVNVPALTAREFDELARKMQDANNGIAEITPARFTNLPRFALTSAIFKYVFAYLHSENNIFRQQKVLDVLDVYMSGYSYLAFSLGVGTAYHASFRKLGLVSQAPFWYFKFDYTDQQTRTLNYIVDNFIFNEKFGTNADEFYKLGRLFTQSDLPLNEFAQNLDHLSVLGCFPREAEQLSFYQEHIAQQAAKYQSNYVENFVPSLRRAYARLLETMQALRQAQQDEHQVVEKDPELNLDLIIDLNSYLVNDDPLYFANHVYHLADIYTNYSELPDYVALDYSSPQLLPVKLDCYTDQAEQTFVPAFLGFGEERLAPVVVRKDNEIFVANLTEEQTTFIRQILEAQMPEHTLIADQAPWLAKFSQNALPKLEAYKKMRNAKEENYFKNFTAEQLEVISGAYNQALEKTVETLAQRDKVNPLKYFLSNELPPHQKSGILNHVGNNVLVPLVAMLEPKVDFSDELALVQSIQTEHDRKLLGQAKAGEFPTSLRNSYDKIMPHAVRIAKLQQELNGRVFMDEHGNKVATPDLTSLVAKPVREVRKQSTTASKVRVTQEPKPIAAPKNQILRMSRSARSKKGKK